MPRWRSPTSLLVLAILLIANVVTLLAVGTLFFVFASKPAGFVIAGVRWLAATLLRCQRYCGRP